VAGVRVDYLAADGSVAATVFFRDQRWPSAAVPWSSLDWAPAASFSAEPIDLGSGDATLDVAGHAPPGWASTREIDVGVVLAGSDGDAVYRVALR
jgi:hypothetical protein